MVEQFPDPKTEKEDEEDLRRDLYEEAKSLEKLRPYVPPEPKPQEEEKPTPFRPDEEPIKPSEN